MAVNKKVKNKQNNVKLSRKERRKQERKSKKVRKHEYYTNRKKPGAFVLAPKEDIKKETVAKPKKNVQTNSFDLSNRIKKEKDEQRKLQKQMDKQRKKQLQQANEEEDRNIKFLEKQLKLKKSKTTSVPKSFATDGLDYLLEVCDSENIKGAVAAEQNMVEANDDFTEDLALISGKSIKKKRKEKEEDFEEDESMSDNSNEFDEQDDSDFDDINEDVKESVKGSSKRKDKSVADEVVVKKLKLSSDESETDDELENGDELGSDDDELENDDKLEKDDDEVENNDSDVLGKKETDTWEDIYGRLRTNTGSVVSNNDGKYVPPALRAKLEDFSEDKKRLEKLNRLRKQLKGLLNRLAEANMHSISTQIEQLYMNNSRNDMNETLTKLIFDSLVAPVISPERLLMEHVMLVTILHANVGTEIGAHFLQMVVKKFDELFNIEAPVEDKHLDNIINIIAQLYNFKVFHSQLLYQILSKLSGKFEEKSVECILLVLKSIGFSLRKDDPLALKSLILSLQKKAVAASEDNCDNSRVKFMLEILMAIKNNNMTKIPNYDTSYSEHLKKLIKGLIRKGNYVTQLNISLEDLLKVEERGKWWVVGSAWTGNIDNTKTSNEPKQTECYSQKLLDLARKQRMNTDTRRSIFCILMSAEDYLDAFEKLLHLGLKNQQEREIIHVLVHCCLKEKIFNSYYAVLAQKFCDYDRKFQMAIKCSVWDKLKTLNECSAVAISNLAKLLTHLFIEKGLPISTLKLVQFGELDKVTLRFIRQILLGILLHKNQETCLEVFAKLGLSNNLKMFKESLRLFIHHFLLKNLKAGTIPEEQSSLLEERAKLVENILLNKKSSI